MFFIFGGDLSQKTSRRSQLMQRSGCGSSKNISNRSTCFIFFRGHKTINHVARFASLASHLVAGLAGLDGPVIAHWLGARRRFEIRRVQLDGGGGGNGACGQRSLLKNDWLTEVIGFCERCYWMRRECLGCWDDEGKLNNFEVWISFSFEKRNKFGFPLAGTKQSERQILREVRKPWCLALGEFKWLQQTLQTRRSS